MYLNMIHTLSVRIELNNSFGDRVWNKTIELYLFQSIGTCVSYSLNRKISPFDQVKVLQIASSYFSFIHTMSVWFKLFQFDSYYFSLIQTISVRFKLINSFLFKPLNRKWKYTISRLLWPIPFEIRSSAK